MKSLLVTLGLCAALGGSLAASVPATASPTLPLPPPRVALPNLSQLPAVAATAQIVPPFPLLRAELTAQLFTQPVGPSYPHWHWIIGVVRNIGFIDSGPFETWIGRAYAGTPMLPGPAIATEVPMDIPAGSQQVVIWAEYLTGPLQVGMHADYTDVVPDYNDLYDTASLTVWP